MNNGRFLYVNNEEEAETLLSGGSLLSADGEEITMGANDVVVAPDEADDIHDFLMQNVTSLLSSVSELTDKTNSLQEQLDLHSALASDNIMELTFDSTVTTGEAFTVEFGDGFEVVEAIDWGDGTINQSNIHEYQEAGVYKVRIAGSFVISEDKSPWLLFQGQEALVSVKLPKTMTVIGSYLFEGCGYVTHIEIPEGVTEILADAFDDTALETIEIPSTVVLLQGLDDLTSLKTLICKALTPPALNGQALPTSLEKIIVPREALERYKEEDNEWGYGYADIIDAYALISDISSYFG